MSVVERLLAPAASLAGRRVLITGGGIGASPISPLIWRPSNSSSGAYGSVTTECCP